MSSQGNKRGWENNNNRRKGGGNRNNSRNANSQRSRPHNNQQRQQMPNQPNAWQNNQPPMTLMQPNQPGVRPGLQYMAANGSQPVVMVPNHMLSQQNGMQVPMGSYMTQPMMYTAAVPGMNPMQQQQPKNVQQNPQLQQQMVMMHQMQQAMQAQAIQQQAAVAQQQQLLIQHQQQQAAAQQQQQQQNPQQNQQNNITQQQKKPVNVRPAPTRQGAQQSNIKAPPQQQKPPQTQVKAQPQPNQTVQMGNQNLIMGGQPVMMFQPGMQAYPMGIRYPQMNQFGQMRVLGPTPVQMYAGGQNFQYQPQNFSPQFPQQQQPNQRPPTQPPQTVPPQKPPQQANTSAAPNANAVPQQNKKPIPGKKNNNNSNTTAKATTNPQPKLPPKAATPLSATAAVFIPGQSGPAPANKTTSTKLNNAAPSFIPPTGAPSTTTASMVQPPSSATGLQSTSNTTDYPAVIVPQSASEFHTEKKPVAEIQQNNNNSNNNNSKPEEETPQPFSSNEPAKIMQMNDPRPMGNHINQIPSSIKNITELKTPENTSPSHSAESSQEISSENVHELDEDIFQSFDRNFGDDYTDDINDINSSDEEEQDEDDLDSRRERELQDQRVANRIYERNYLIQLRASCAEPHSCFDTSYADNNKLKGDTAAMIERILDFRTPSGRKGGQGPSRDFFGNKVGRKRKTPRNRHNRHQQQNRMPNINVKPLTKTENGWMRTYNRNAEHPVMVQRKTNNLLGKLAPDNKERIQDLFNELAVEMMGLEDVMIVVETIFNKAWREKKYANLYADLCYNTVQHLGSFEDMLDKKKQFKRSIISLCQQNFQQKLSEDDYKNLNEEEQTAKVRQQKLKMLGNIRFIGNLYKQQLVREKVIHNCMQALLDPSTHKDMNKESLEKDLESVVELLKTVGQNIDVPKAQAWMDQYFKYLKYYQKKVEPRMRFLIQDIIELRETHDWVHTGLEKDEEVKSKAEVAAEENAKMAAARSSNNRHGGYHDRNRRHGGHDRRNDDRGHNRNDSRHNNHNRSRTNISTGGRSKASNAWGSSANASQNNRNKPHRNRSGETDKQILERTSQDVRNKSQQARGKNVRGSASIRPVGGRTRTSRELNRSPPQTRQQAPVVPVSSSELKKKLMELVKDGEFLKQGESFLLTGPGANTTELWKAYWESYIDARSITQKDLFSTFMHINRKVQSFNPQALLSWLSSTSQQWDDFVCSLDAPMAPKYFSHIAVELLVSKRISIEQAMNFVPQTDSANDGDDEHVNKFMMGFLERIFSSDNEEMKDVILDNNDLIRSKFVFEPQAYGNAARRTCIPDPARTESEIPLEEILGVGYYDQIVVAPPRSSGRGSRARESRV